MDATNFVIIFEIYLALGDSKEKGVGYIDNGLLLTMLRQNEERIKKLEEKVNQSFCSINHFL